MSAITSSAQVAGNEATAAEINKFRDDILNCAGDYASATGSSNAFVLALDSDVDALVTGLVIKFKANHSITGAATINVNSLGDKSITKNGTNALVADDIVNGQVVICVYDGTQFQIISGVPSGGGGSLSPIFTMIQYGDGNFNNARYGGILTDDGKKLIGEGNGATQFIIWTRPSATCPFGRTSNQSETSLSITPDLIVKVDIGGTEYVLAVARGGTSMYRYDNAATTASETSITFSGGSIVTGARRLGWDGTYLYIQDGSDDTATAIKRFTLSGSTATYFDTITLGTAPSDTSSNAGKNILVTGTHMWFYDDDPSNGQTINQYALSDGSQTATHEVDSATSPMGIFVKWDDPAKGWICNVSGNDSYQPHYLLMPFDPDSIT